MAAKKAAAVSAATADGNDAAKQVLQKLAFTRNSAFLVIKKT